MSDFGGFGGGHEHHGFCPGCGGYDGYHDFERHNQNYSGGGTNTGIWIFLGILLLIGNPVLGIGLLVLLFVIALAKK